MRQSIPQAEGTLRRDRLMVLAGLVSISALAWAYLISHTFEMGTMEMAASMQIWTAMDFVLRFVMWAVMMIAMMVPTRPRR